MASSLPAPPQSIQFSSSFAFAYSTPDIASPLQPIVRRTIERFSDMTQLINIIVTLKSQSQAKNLFAPDPPRPLAVIDDEEAQIATWLVDLAKYYHKSSDAPDASINGVMNGQQQMVVQNKLSDSSRSFLVASHAVLALHQILPYATTASNAYGSPLPLPTVESLRTALTALHLVARSIQVSAPGTRTRTQAILLDAMPRVLSLLEVFTSSSLSSLDHFVLVTSQRQLVHELLDDLNRAIACMSSPGAGTPSLDSCGTALAKSSKSLRTVVDIGMELQQRQDGSNTMSLPGSVPHPYQVDYSIAPSTQVQGIANQATATVPGTPSTPSASTDSASSHGTYQEYGVNAANMYTGAQDAYVPSNLVGNHYDRQSLSLGVMPHASSAVYGSGMIDNQFARPEHFSMSSHLANSPLFRNPDRTVAASPSYIGSLHAYL
ncbi:hypothetical protein P389DRAFT_114546 [Cystobasidium minutum MCA 4210]|uniref:uncharacterized protein n=1 Tax=Cystobasidium minutum MCA 4210 TaxID=1397322 RepID=UPI0034CE50B5|eukprot:jgi/Rhomi1/114546/CE114545_556